MSSESRATSVSRSQSARVVTKEGWLMKTGNGSLTKGLYKKRWCILYGGSFSYMKKKEDSEPKGHIFLSNKTSIGRTNDKRHPFTFEIRPAPGERIYRMQALDEDDRDEWLRELANVRGITRFDITEVPEADDASYEGMSRPARTSNPLPADSSSFDNTRHSRSASQPESGVNASSPRRGTSSAALPKLQLETKTRAKSPSRESIVLRNRSPSRGRSGTREGKDNPPTPSEHKPFNCEASGHRFQDGGSIIFCSACGEQRSKMALNDVKGIYPESTHFSRLAELGTFTFTSKEAVGFEIPPGVPTTARYVLISYFLLCGLEYEKDGPSRIFRVRLWTTGGHVMWKMGARYPQTSLSFDSDNLWFPLGATERRLYVQCDDVQTVSCRAIELFVAGYR